MIIDVSDISKTEGESKDVTFENFLGGNPEGNPGGNPEGNDNIFNDIFGDEIYNINASFSGEIRNVGGNKLKLEGTIDAEYKVACSRCLDDFTEHVEAEVNEEFTFHTAVAGFTPDEEVYIWRGNTVNVDKPLTDVLLLNIPVVHLCKDDCKGLCQRCGGNMNRETCDCVIDSNMEV